MRCSSAHPNNGAEVAELRAATRACPAGEGEPFFHRSRVRRVNASATPVRWVLMRIAKAIVLATESRGREPWPNLGFPSRHLAPVANKPVLFRHLEALAKAGVS